MFFFFFFFFLFIIQCFLELCKIKLFPCLFYITFPTSLYKENLEGIVHPSICLSSCYSLSFYTSKGIKPNSHLPPMHGSCNTAMILVPDPWPRLKGQIEIVIFDCYTVTPLTLLDIFNQICCVLLGPRPRSKCQSLLSPPTLLGGFQLN